MTRKTRLFAALTALLASGISACTVHVKSGDEAANTPPPAPTPAPPPAPPPPPPATAAPAPAPTPSATTPAPAPAPAPTADVKMSGNTLSMPGAIVFDTGKATLKAGAGSEAVLDQLKKFLDQNSKDIAVLRIEGHTDNQGAEAQNLELSGQRALTIKKYLVDHGEDASHLVAVGFGSSKPIAPNNSEEGRAKNRRTEFKIAKTYDKKGKPQPYLGQDPLGGGKEFQ